MKVYNKDKTQILESYDLSQGHLESSYIDLPEVQSVKEKGHWKTIAEYPETGGKDVEWVVDVAGVEYQPARREEILIYIPYTDEEIIENKKNRLRRQRWKECFSIINRGELWYDMLTEKQKAELNVWYQAWLHITDNVTLDTDIEKIIPEKPSWLK